MFEPNTLGLGEHRCGSTLQSLELLWHHTQQPIKIPNSVQSLKQGHHTNQDPLTNPSHRKQPTPYTDAKFEALCPKFIIPR